MTDQNQKNQNKNSGGFNPLAAAVTGVIVGAGVVAAGAMALNDKKNRDRISDAATALKDQVVEFGDSLQNQTENTQAEIEASLKKGEAQVKSGVKKATEIVQEKSQKITKAAQAAKKELA